MRRCLAYAQSCYKPHLQTPPQTLVLAHAWRGVVRQCCLAWRLASMYPLDITHAAPPWPIMHPVGCKLSVSLSERKADPNASYGRGGGGGGYRCALSPHGHATHHGHDCFSALYASVVDASLRPLPTARRDDAGACADLCVLCPDAAGAVTLATAAAAAVGAMAAAAVVAVLVVAGMATGPAQGEACCACSKGVMSRPAEQRGLVIVLVLPRCPCGPPAPAPTV